MKNLGIGLAVILLGATAHAQAVGPGKPGPEIYNVKGYATNVQCEGKSTTADGKQVAYKSTWGGRVELSGFWTHVTYRRDKTAEVASFDGAGMMGYDTASKKYMMLGVDNWGGWINLTSADGLVFEGQGNLGHQLMQVKFTFGRDAAGKVTSFTGEAGGHTIFQDTCR